MKKNNFKKVILRACDDEPIVRYVSRREDGAIMVRSEKSYHDFLKGKGLTNWIGWHEEDVFSYDSAMFNELSMLFTSSDKKPLKGAWNKLKPYY